MASDNELKYKIGVTADTTGAVAAEKAIEKVDAAAKEAAKGAGAAADGLKGLADAAEDTADKATGANSALRDTTSFSQKLAGASQALGSALNGNIGALGKLPSELGKVGAAFLANPLFGAAAVLGSLVIPVIARWRAGWVEAGEAAQAAAAKSAEALEAARNAVAEKRSNETANQFREIMRAADEARRSIEAVTTAQIERIDAEEAVTVARFNAQPGVSDVDRIVGRADIRARFAQRRDAAALQGIDQGVDLARSTAEQARSALRTTTEEEARVQAERDRLASRSPEAIGKEIEQLRAAEFAIQRTPTYNMADLDAANAKRAELLAKIVIAETELASATASYANSIADADKRLAAATKKRENAERIATDSIAAAAGAERQAKEKADSINLRSATQREVETYEINPALRAAGRPERAVRNSIAQPGLIAAEEAALAAKTTEAAATVAGAVGAANPLREAIILFNGQTIRAVGGLQRDLQATKDLVADQARQMERLRASVENIKTSSQ